MGPTVWVLFLFFVFLQSKPSADNDKHEGEKKHKTNEEMRDCRTTKNIKQDKTTQSRKPRQSTD